MMKDKDLELLFQAHRPKFDDKDEFMKKLERRLVAVEYIKQYEEASRRRYRYAMIATFVLGVLSGAILLSFMLGASTGNLLFSLQVASEVVLVLQDNQRMIFAVILMMVTSCGIIGLVGNVQELAKNLSSSSSL